MAQSGERSLALARDLPVSLQRVLLALAERQAGFGGEKRHHKLKLVFRQHRNFTMAAPAIQHMHFHTRRNPIQCAGRVQAV
jgi:hypothetical protein